MARRSNSSYKQLPTPRCNLLGNSDSWLDHRLSTRKYQITTLREVSRNSISYLRRGCLRLVDHRRDRHLRSWWSLLHCAARSSALLCISSLSRFLLRGPFPDELRQAAGLAQISDRPHTRANPSITGGVVCFSERPITLWYNRRDGQKMATARARAKSGRV